LVRNAHHTKAGKDAQAGKPVPPVLKIIINDLTKRCFFPNFFKMDLKQKTENRKPKTGF